MSESSFRVPVVGALLAGGASRRMGVAKGALVLGGCPLAAWAAAALAPLADPVLQIGGEPLSELGLDRIPDRRPATGPGAGLEAALLYAPGAIVVVCALDTPFVSTNLLAATLQRVEEGAIAAAPRHGSRWHPLAAAYGPAFLPPLQAWLDSGRHDLQGLCDGAGVAAVEGDELAALGDPARLLYNINEPADLERARRWLGAS